MSVPAGNGPGWETVAVVHCQDGSNPPSPAPPLVLGTLLPHFISGKFSRLLAQTQERISRRGVCVRSSPPAPPRHHVESSPGSHRGAGSAEGQLPGQCSPPGRLALHRCLAAAGPAPAPIPSQHPCPVQGLADSENMQRLHPAPIAFLHPPRMDSKGTSARRAARVLPLCPQAVLV